MTRRLPALACLLAALPTGGCFLVTAQQLRFAERDYASGVRAERAGDLVGARSAYAAGLVKAETAGSVVARAYMMYELGRVSGYTCDAERGRSLMEQSLVLQRSNPAELRQLLAPTLNELARLLYDTGRFAEAVPYYDEGIALARVEAAAPRKLAEQLDELAASLQATGEAERAGQARADAEQLRASTPRHPDTPWLRYAANCFDVAAVERSALAGDRAAQRTLARGYAFGWRVAKDMAQAAKWYRMAAEAGDAEAQNTLGNLYENGEGVSQDYELARLWLEKSSAQGVPVATHALAYLYDGGLGVPEDNARALELYRQAAASGEPRAMLNLSVSYLQGDGVAADPVEAYGWLVIARDGATRFDATVHATLPPLLAQLDAQLGAEQIASAKQRAAAWLEAHPQARTPYRVPPGAPGGALPVH